MFSGTPCNLEQREGFEGNKEQFENKTIISKPGQKCI